MNALISTESNPVTMSSLEMVEYINEQRKQDALAAGSTFPSKEFAKLRHDSFMDKVPEVLGENAPKFIGTQKYGNNNTREIYTFPKREACLMAMSYSYDLQAKVFDKMTALENATRNPIALMGGMQAITEQINEIVAHAIAVNLPALLHGEMAKSQSALRRGMTAGQVWSHYNLPKFKGAAVWLSHRLEKNDCAIAGSGRGELGGKTAKLFDPDKVDVRMKSGLLAYCKQYTKERAGQGSLFSLKVV